MGVANAILRSKRLQQAQKKDTDLVDQDSPNDGRVCDTPSDMSSPSSPSRGLVRCLWFLRDHCFSQRFMSFSVIGLFYWQIVTYFLYISYIYSLLKMITWTCTVMYHGNCTVISTTVLVIVFGHVYWNLSKHQRFVIFAARLSGECLTPIIWEKAKKKPSFFAASFCYVVRCSHHVFCLMYLCRWMCLRCDVVLVP